MLAARTLPPARRAELAATYAKDHHVTRAKAAQLFEVTPTDVIVAWETLYPDDARVRT